MMNEIKKILQKINNFDNLYASIDDFWIKNNPNICLRFTIIEKKGYFHNIIYFKEIHENETEEKLKKIIQELNCICTKHN